MIESIAMARVQQRLSDAKADESTSAKVARCANNIFIDCIKVFAALILLGLSVFFIATVGFLAALPFAALATVCLIVVIAQRIINHRSKKIDLCALLDKGTQSTRVNPQVGTQKLYHQFHRDCVRDRNRYIVDGRPLVEKFSEECAQLVAEQDDDKLEVIREDLRGKLGQELERITREQLGEDTQLLAPISAAMSQEIGIMLNEEMRLLAEKKYRGQLMKAGTDPKGTCEVCVEFPKDGKVAAKITVQASDTFGRLMRPGEFEGIELAPPCGYKGTATIEIDHAGLSTIKKQVKLASLL